jgi:AcrR family transcriptional regulator
MTDRRVKGTYDNSRRAARARETRRAVVDAAHDLLLARGFAGMRLADVAERAGVSVETVYKQFRGKGGLLKAAYDVRLAGDDEPVSLADRPEYRAIGEESDPARKVRRYAAVGRRISERAGPLTARVLESRGADPEVEEFARTIEAERLVGATTFVAHLDQAGALRPDLDADRARDVLWVLISPEVWAQLVQRRGWTNDQYEAWLAEAVSTALLGDGSPG